MNKENILLIGLLVLVVGIFLYAVSGFYKGGNVIKIGTITPYQSNKPVSGGTEIPQSKFEKKASDSVVTVGLTPIEFKDGKLYVNIGVDTHSGDLSKINLVDSTVLEFEGKSIKPASAPKLTGHHTSGQLTFDTGKELERFKIKIKGIPEIEERIFEWP